MLSPYTLSVYEDVDKEIEKKVEEYHPTSRLSTLDGKWSEEMVELVEKFQKVIKYDMNIYKQTYKRLNIFSKSIQVILGFIGAVSIYFPASGANSEYMNKWSMISGGVTAFLTTAFSKTEFATSSAYYKERYKQTKKMVEYLEHQSRKQTIDPDELLENLYNMRLKMLEDE